MGCTCLLEKTMKPLLGKRRFQHFFEKLHAISLAGMNFGGSGLINGSGENIAAEYCKENFRHSIIGGMPPIIVFDVGANIGEFSSLISDVFSDMNKKIYSFEPSQITFKKLSKNLKTLSNINVFNFGFGEKKSKSSLYSNTDASSLASVYKRKLDHFNIKMDKKEEILIRTIDDFCEEQKILKIHFLKIDAEGHEFKILEGANRMLDNGAIDYIQFEFGGCDIDSRTFFQDFYYLLSKKYRIYRIVQDGLIPITQYKEAYEIFITMNYLAERKT